MVNIQTNVRYDSICRTKYTPSPNWRRPQPLNLSFQLGFGSTNSRSTK